MNTTDRDREEAATIVNACLNVPNGMALEEMRSRLAQALAARVQPFIDAGLADEQGRPIKLPKTIDGVFVVPGMELFAVDPNGHVEEFRTAFAWEKRYHTLSSGPLPCYTHESLAYASRKKAEEAALAAKERGQ